MYGILYKAISPSGKIYIGQTVYTLSDRRAKHMWAANHKKENGDWKNTNKFAKALRKYGDLFNWEVLDVCATPSELDLKEVQAIEFYESYTKGYNSTLGGDFSHRGSPEVGKKISASMLAANIKRTPEHMAKCHAAAKASNKGRIHSPEIRQKMSLAALGRARTLEHCQNISKAKKGKRQSLATREKKRQSMLKTMARKREEKNGAVAM